MSSVMSQGFQVVDSIFKLFDRDCSGFARKADILAALSTITLSDERSYGMLTRLEESGQLDQVKFQNLLEACVELSLSKGSTVHSLSVRQTRLVKIALAIARDFERRATLAEQFREAASARQCMSEIRTAEEARQYDSLSTRQLQEREVVQEAQAAEVAKFSSAWRASLAEYELSASVRLQHPQHI